MDFLGPLYYSFDYGPSHFIAYDELHSVLLALLECSTFRRNFNQKGEKPRAFYILSN